MFRLVVAGLALVSMGMVTFAHAQDFFFNQYSIWRISPAAKYFTPGSIIFGYNYRGVLKLEMVCRNKVNVETDDDILRSGVEQAGFFSQTGFKFSAGANVVEVLNAEFGAQLVKDVTLSVTDVTMYEYSAEDMAAIRARLLARPGCRQALRSKRYKYQDSFNGAPAGLFQNQRFAIGNLRYDIQFNKDNPKALNLSVQSLVAKKLRLKFGLTYLNASGNTLDGKGVVLGVFPVWQPNW